MNKITIIIVAMFLMQLAPLQAAPWDAYTSYDGYYEQQAPGKLLKQGLDKVITFLGDGGYRNPQQLERFVEQEIAGYFDFAYMAQWVLGPRLRQMSSKQKDKATRMLRGMLLNAMVRKLADYQHVRLMYLRPRGNPASGQVQLSIRSFPLQGYPTQLDFLLYRGQQGWRVFDVSANGQSAVLHFRNVLAHKGDFNF